MAELSTTPPHRRFLLECSGACGDLGTFTLERDGFELLVTLRTHLTERGGTV